METFRFPYSHSERPEMCLSLDPSDTSKYFMRGFSSPMRVTQEGPDSLSLYCPVRVIVRINDEQFLTQETPHGKDKTVHSSFVVGGINTHKVLHVVAVVDQKLAYAQRP